MHLIFKEKSLAWLGEVKENNGCIEDISLTKEGQKELSRVFKDWQTTGIPCLKAISEANKHQKCTRFVHEFIPLNTSDALQAFQHAGTIYGFLMMTLSTKQAKYWKEIRNWPLSPTMKYNLLFTLRNLPKEGWLAWENTWESLKSQMAAI